MCRTSPVLSGCGFSRWAAGRGERSFGDCKGNTNGHRYPKLHRRRLIACMFAHPGHFLTALAQFSHFTGNGQIPRWAPHLSYRTAVKLLIRGPPSLGLLENNLTKTPSLFISSNRAQYSTSLSSHRYLIKMAEAHRALLCSKQEQRIPPSYIITRRIDLSLQFNPPIGSLELANALSLQYPFAASLAEQIHCALLQHINSEKAPEESTSQSSCHPSEP
jgi:hypothetical protein